MNRNILITGILLVLIFGFYVTVGERKVDNRAEAGNSIACTMEAKLCGDGSYVGRTGPKCEFTACPGGLERYTTNYGFSFVYKDQYLVTPKELGNAERSHYSITLITRKDALGIQNAAEGPRAITVDIFQNPEKLSVDKWIRGDSNSNFKLSKTQKIKKGTISGKDVSVYKWEGLYQAGSVVFAHNGSIVMASVTYDSDSDEIKSDFIDLIQSIKF